MPCHYSRGNSEVTADVKKLTVHTKLCADFIHYESHGSVQMSENVTRCRQACDDGSF